MSDTALLEKPVEQQDTSAAPPLLAKYHYAEFGDYVGERYLDSMLMQILPYSLWRTWHYAVDFQRPDSQCYVGTTRLAARLKPGIRKIELDFQELLARGLMRKYADRLPVGKDGKLEAVTVKDFTPLYDLAHEYHLWSISEEFIPPVRDQMELLKGDPHLLAKVLRFDNYRRLLENHKPGRKAQPQPIHLYYQIVRPEDNQGWEDAPEQAPTPAQEGQEAETPQNANLYSNVPDNTSSPYRESRSKENLLPTDSISSDLGERGDAAIGNDTTNAETEDTQPKSKPNHPNPSTQEEVGGAARVKDAEVYNIDELKRDPYAMAAALIEMRARGELGGDVGTAPANPSQRPKKQQRPRRMPPAQLVRTIAQFGQELGDNPKSQASNLTRASKLYFAATQIFGDFSNSKFKKQLDAAFEDACKRGVKKRMPYFFVVLENLLELNAEELAYTRSEEPLYADGDIRSFINKLRRQYEKSGSTLDYDKWIRQTWLISSGSPRRE